MTAAQLNIFSANTSDIVNYAPKLLLFDLNTNQFLRTFVFPDAVAPYNSSFLNDIVVDEVHGVAYMSDTGAVGGIVVYDFASNTARRWGGDPSQQADPNFNFTINGTSYHFPTNEDGIALSADLQARPHARLCISVHTRVCLSLSLSLSLPLYLSLYLSVVAHASLPFSPV